MPRNLCMGLDMRLNPQTSSVPTRDNTATFQGVLSPCAAAEGLTSHVGSGSSPRDSAAVLRHVALRSGKQIGCFSTVHC